MFFCFVLSQYVTPFLTILVTVKCKLLPTLFPRGVTSAKHEEYASRYFFGRRGGGVGLGGADMHVMDGLLVGFRT